MSVSRNKAAVVTHEDIADGVHSIADLAEWADAHRQSAYDAAAPSKPQLGNRAAASVEIPDRPTVGSTPAKAEQR